MAPAQRTGPWPRSRAVRARAAAFALAAGLLPGPAPAAADVPARIVAAPATAPEAPARASGIGDAPPARSAQRIVTLAPSATELVFAAGAGGRIVGTVLSSDYPPQARGIPRVGDGVQLSEETILALRPGLVVAWQPSTPVRAVARRLESLDVPVLYTDAQRLEDIPRLVRELGRRLGTQAVADPAADALEARIAALRPAPPPPVSVFIELGSEPLYTLGHDPLVNDLITRCGGRNPYAGSPIAAPQPSIESVLQIDPGVVIVSPYAGETLQARTAWWAGYGLRAAREGRIYAIDPDWLHRPGPRLVDAAEALCRDLRASSGQAPPASASATPAAR